MQSSPHSSCSTKVNIRACLIFCLILGAIVSFTLGYHCAESHASAADNFFFPLAYSLIVAIPSYVVIESVGKGIVRLKERLDHGLKNKKILLVGDKEERNNVFTQMAYSNLFENRNITNASEPGDYVYTDYDLIIACFSKKDLKEKEETEERKNESNGLNKHGPKMILNNEADNLLQEIRNSIGDSEGTKTTLENTNNEIIGLIVLCPNNSLDYHRADHLDLFKRPFTAVVNQVGRMMTDIFSLLTTLPPRNRD